jgi:selenocysteine-specific elongation factor
MEIQPVVIGTAGHIDHGKSTLVRTLTGIDPDRLPEEKARGLTIDLGFANIALPDGRRVGIVDVPGHERFVRNMVAGATGIDLVVLVVAADDGVMPQTREHLAIMQMLGIERGLVALTKIDAVDRELVDLARADLESFLAGTFLENAPIFPLSSHTLEGFDAFKAKLFELAMQCEPRRADGVFRMPVQRVFSKPGFGTVCTGIPVSGSAAVGDVLEVLPAKKRGKVRSVQAYGEQHGHARAGHSSALVLVDVTREDVVRGDVVATPGYFEAVRMVAARLTVLATLDRPVKDRTRVRMHTGTADPSGDLVLLEGTELLPGASGLCQIRLDAPVVVGPGDRFVLRLLSPETTLGGGVLLEESRHRLKRNKAFVLDELALTESSLDSPRELLATFLLRRHLEPADANAAAAAIKRDPATTQTLLDELVTAKEAVRTTKGATYLHTKNVDDGLLRLEAAVAAWFGANPARLKAPLLEVRRAAELEADVFAFLLDIAARAGTYVMTGGGELARPSAAKKSDPASDAAHALLAAAGLMPPPPAELGLKLGGEKNARNLLARLCDEGRAVRVSPEMYFAAEHFERAKAAVIENCKAHGHVELPALRERIDTTRKWLIPLLEHLDAVGVTMRQGAHRVLRGR